MNDKNLIETFNYIHVKIKLFEHTIKSHKLLKVLNLGKLINQYK